MAEGEPTLVSSAVFYGAVGLHFNGAPSHNGPMDLPALAGVANSPPAEPATLAVRAENDRLTKLETETATLRRELAELRAQFADFRKQFE